MLQSPRGICEVDADGIAHVFTRFAVGAVCACGRTVVGLTEREDEVVLRRAAGEGLDDLVVALPTVARLAGSGDDRAAPFQDVRGPHDDLLAMGATAIERARALRRTATARCLACRATHIRCQAAGADRRRRRRA